MFGNVLILGDSYSTFTGYIPDGYSTYYRPEGPDYHVYKGLELTENDVTDVKQTWWYNLINENGKLILNSSWSGTPICNTGYGGIDTSGISFVARFEKLLEEGFFTDNKIDTIFLFGGTNDSCANSPIGENKLADWETEDLKCVFPAFSYLIDKMVRSLPDTKIYCILNTELKIEIGEFYELVCEKYGVPFIRLHDIEKRLGHPTIKGMLTIKEQILDFIKSE